MPIQDFILLEELGRGSFGTVHKCLRRADNKVYAIKQVKFAELKQKDKQNALNQIRLLASVEDTYIISYKEAFFDETTKTLSIVMEFANEGDLSGKIKKHIEKETKFREIEVWKTAYHLLKGCKKLHDSKIMHRDIKSANIFYSNGIAKLGDLNVSKYIESNLATTQTGTPYYAAPEIWSDDPYGPKCDIWSVGVVLYEMCMLKPPFRAHSIEGLYRKIMVGQYQKIPSPYSKSLALLITKCLTVDHKQRPGTDQLLQNPVFLDLDSNKNVEELDIQLLQTINMPSNIKFLNDQLPASKYEEDPVAKRRQKKGKTVVFEDVANQMGSQVRLPSLTPMKSEKNLHLPKSTKLIPLEPQTPSKSINKSRSLKRIPTTKVMGGQTKFAIRQKVRI